MNLLNHPICAERAIIMRRSLAKWQNWLVPNYIRSDSVSITLMTTTARGRLAAAAIAAGASSVPLLLSSFVSSKI